METNIAFDSKLENSSQSTADSESLLELVNAQEEDQDRATSSLPALEKIKTGKKSVLVFNTVIIVVALVLALMTLALAVIAINSNQGIQSLQSEMNILNMKIQTEKNISVQKFLNILKKLLPNSFKNPLPVTSCRDIPHYSPSEKYWILNSQNSSVNVYCDMDHSSRGWNATGGWMRVANLDMTDPSQHCPDGFRLVTSYSYRRGVLLRTCGKPGPPGCVSTIYPSYSVEYSNVCGRIRGFQFASSDAFGPYRRNTSRTIDSDYVDGVSLTHGRSPRQHIWTFAAAYNERASTHYDCPCTQSGVPYTGTVPPFIGQDYFCDTGSRESFRFRLYDNDPLWDGQGCGSNSTCCEFNNPPWFCKQLPQPTTDDIELRLCSDELNRNEGTPLELVEIYVQ